MDDKTAELKEPNVYVGVDQSGFQHVAYEDKHPFDLILDELRGLLSQ